MGALGKTLSSGSNVWDHNLSVFKGASHCLLMVSLYFFFFMKIMHLLLFFLSWVITCALKTLAVMTDSQPLCGDLTHEGRNVQIRYIFYLFIYFFSCFFFLTLCSYGFSIFSALNSYLCIVVWHLQNPRAEAALSSSLACLRPWFYLDRPHTKQAYLLSVVSWNIMNLYLNRNFWITCILISVLTCLLISSGWLGSWSWMFYLLHWCEA